MCFQTIQTTDTTPQVSTTQIPAHKSILGAEATGIGQPEDKEEGVLRVEDHQSAAAARRGTRSVEREEDAERRRIVGRFGRRPRSELEGKKIMSREEFEFKLNCCHRTVFLVAINRDGVRIHAT